MSHEAVAHTPAHHERERLLRMLAVATFMIFFQAYMVAPIIPTLSNAFGTSVQTVGLVVPAYLIPYGIATLVYGLLADRLGARGSKPETQICWKSISFSGLRLQQCND